MRQFTKAAVLAAGLSVVSQAAQAAFTANDIYLGFSQSSASGDYLIDLGQASAIGVGGNSVVDLSSHISMSMFDSIFTGGADGVSVGAVGGQNLFPSTYNIFATALRETGAGDASIPGSDLSGFNHSQTTIASSVSDLGQVPFPMAGDDVADSGKMWTAHVNALNPGSFYGDSGVNPSSTIGGSGVIYQDLWGATASSSYSYMGFFTIDLSGAQPGLSFTPVAVPEPTAGALACLGLAGFFALRGRKAGKNA